MRISIPITDIKIEPYIGSGPGGQHKNTSYTCIKAIHKPTKIMAQGCDSRSQKTNKKMALKRLAEKLKIHYTNLQTATDYSSNEIVRTYHHTDNYVKDHASKFRQPWKSVVEKPDLSKMITARAKAILSDTQIKKQSGRIA